MLLLLSLCRDSVLTYQGQQGRAKNAWRALAVLDGVNFQRTHYNSTISASCQPHWVNIALYKGVMLICRVAAVQWVGAADPYIVG